MAEAADWYDSQAPGRGDDFLRSLQHTIESVCRNPYQYQVLRGELRRAVLRKYPYLIIYAVSQDEVTVLRCVHARRDPRTWLNQI
jgi:plasmid stabilization system protein ParE